ncbi:M48 family metallopeptidase [Neorhizobium sp. NPDC001467]|uniref:M48 family metallopeptidase n=1 Tax=Neorhizobium sp. NPDC001467 TaxID=3390595 RepID=UPI003D05EBDB
MASDDDTVIARGEWHPAHSSRAVAADLREKDGRLVVAADALALTSGLHEEVEISERVGSIPRRLTFLDGSVFETRDNKAIDAVTSRHGSRRGGLVHRLEQFHPRLIAFTLAVFLLAIGIYRYALPVMVEIAVLVTPPVVPQMIGASTLASLDQTLLSQTALPPQEQEAIRAEFARLAAHARGGAQAYKLTFRDAPVMGPNAFALPDGTLVLTDALVKLADGDRQMVLGVLGHEIAHVEGEHSLRQIYRVAGFAALVMLIAGDVGSGVEDILTQGGTLVALSYSRDAEEAADRRSVELMKAAGYEAAALARFFAILEEKLGDHGDTNMLSTHPGTPARQADIRNYAQQLEGDVKDR